jgi:hypothetical protein
VPSIPRTRHAGGVPGWEPAPGWGQPLAGWQPLVDHGPLPLRAAGSVARWWWPTLAVAGFLAVVTYVTGRDHPSPSNRGLLTIALAAVVVVLLTVHRRAGPWALARAAAEYTAVALLAALLALAGGIDQPPASPTTRSEAEHAATANQAVEAGDHRPGVLRVAAGMVRAITRAIRAVTGAVGWLVDLWRQADAKTDLPNRSTATTAPQGQAMAPSPTPAPSSTRRPL